MSSLSIINVPAANGPGTALDISSFAYDKTIVVANTDPNDFTTVEFSVDGVEFFGAPQAQLRSPTLGVLPSLITNPINPAQGQGFISYGAVVRFVRVNRQSRILGGAAPVAAISAQTSLINSFNALTVPAVNDAAGATFTVPDTFGDQWTFQLSGALTAGNVIVDGSVDGANFAPIATFNRQQPRGQIVTGTFGFLRVRRTGTLTSEQPTVNFGNAGPVSNGVVGNWTGVRNYLLDYDNGSDSAPGYVDTTADQDLTGLTAGRAIKTATKLRQVVASVAPGMRANIFIRPRAGGATYRNPADTADDDLILNVYGYDHLVIRGSDLTNNTADKLICGGITHTAGPNADGSWTVAAGATTSVFSVAAGVLTAEPALLTLRVRFTGNVTAALLNVIGTISTNTAAAITIINNLGVAPAAGDTFFIEHAGFACNRVYISDSIPSVFVANSTASLAGIMLIGVRATVPLNSTTTKGFEFSGKGGLQQAFCQVPNANVNSARCMIVEMFGGAYTSARSYIDLGNVTRQVGGCRFGSGTNGICTLTADSIGWNSAGIISTQQTTNSTLTAVTLLAINTGVFGSGVETIASAFAAHLVGNSGSSVSRVVRIYGASNASSSSAGLLCRGAGRVNGVDITGCSTGPALKFASSTVDSGSVFRCDNLTGSTGNTTFGIHGLDAIGSKFILVTDRVTVTGTNGNITTVGIRGSTSCTLTTADLATTNVIDSNANEWIGTPSTGTGGTVVGQCKAVINGSGAQLNVGHVVRSTGANNTVTTAQANAPANCGGGNPPDPGVVGVMVSTTANAATGYMIDFGTAFVLFDAGPAIGLPAYLSTATAGQAQTANPALAGTNQKLRLARVISTSGNTGIVAWHPENFPIAADGLP